MIHLDTSFLIDALVPGSSQEAQLVGWLAAGETLGISAVAWGEFLWRLERVRFRKVISQA